MEYNLNMPYQARNLQDLIDNAKPEMVPQFNQEGDYKGARTAAPAVLTFGINDSVVTPEQYKALPGNVTARLSRMMDTANSPGVANATPRNNFTWKHMIISANVLSRAGMAIDTSGNFEGTPFIGGFDSQVGTEWLGENAEIPEASPATVKYPYEIHTIGAFTLTSRRLLKLVPGFIPQLQIAQASAIREQVELAFINGDSAVNANQPDGLVKLVQNTQNGATLTGRAVIANVLFALETNGLDMSEVSIVMAPDVARKLRNEVELSVFPTLDPSRLLVSKHMPAGTLVAGRYSDYMGVTGSAIEFLAHTYTPQGVPETGATRVRSLFDVDSVVLNQDSFIKVENIA